MSDPADIIERLGGAEALSKRFNITLKAIEQWGRRGGIPSKRHFELLQIAKERRVKLSLADLSVNARRAA